MNQLLLGCKQSGEAAIVDAGGTPAPFVEAAERHGMQIWHVIQTHAHLDHISALKDTLDALPAAKCYLHPLEAPVYESVAQQADMFGVPLDAPLPDREEHTTPIADGDTLRVGDIALRAHHTPGHAPGHVVFSSTEHQFVVGGDLLFEGSIGRTDLPFCDPDAMAESIRKLYAIEGLGHDCIVLPGHMGITTLGRERAGNPFVGSYLRE